METRRIPRSRATRKANAQGMVEFALMLPILLLVLFGIIDMGWIAFNFSQLYNGVREGVRYGSVYGFPSSGQQPQYLQCDTIRSNLMAQAGFSGITASNITVEYDDGRSIDSTNSLKSRVGTCASGGNFAQ